MPPVSKKSPWPTGNLTIWKYEIDPNHMDEFHWAVPNGFKVLDIQDQHGRICLWALVDPDKELARFKFRVFGTGHPVPKDLPLEYVGTFQLLQGRFVGHLFRVKEE